MAAACNERVVGLLPLLANTFSQVPFVGLGAIAPTSRLLLLPELDMEEPRSGVCGGAPGGGGGSKFMPCSLDLSSESFLKTQMFTATFLSPFASNTGYFHFVVFGGKYGVNMEFGISERSFNEPLFVQASVKQQG